MDCWEEINPPNSWRNLLCTSMCQPLICELLASRLEYFILKLVQIPLVSHRHWSNVLAQSLAMCIRPYILHAALNLCLTLAITATRACCSAYDNTHHWPLQPRGQWLSQTSSSGQRCVSCIRPLPLGAGVHCVTSPTPDSGHDLHHRDNKIHLQQIILALLCMLCLIFTVINEVPYRADSQVNTAILHTTFNVMANHFSPSRRQVHNKYLSHIIFNQCQSYTKSEQFKL